jgi:hypothetical protein
MPTTRRRPETEFEATPQAQGTQTLTLSGLTGGRNGYTNPELLSPQFWAPGTVNVYSGLHGGIRRARWAPTANAGSLPGANGSLITSMFSFSPIGATFPYIILENSNVTPANLLPIEIIKYGSTAVVSISQGPTIPLANILGPYMRFSTTPAMILQTNGLARSKLFYNGSFFWWFWGLDTPDASPGIVLASGTTATLLAAPNGASRTSNIATYTANAALPANLVVGAFVNVSGVADASFNTSAGQAFQVLTVSSPSFTVSQIGPNTTSGSGTVTVQITKSVGRSYQYAWENANTGHVSAPSPASQYVAYSNQTGTINCIQPGTIATTALSPNVVGTNTFFTSAWIGRTIFVSPVDLAGAVITAVADATHLTMSLSANNTANTLPFQVVDLQATHIRLYETGDGGAVYLRTARNAIHVANGTGDLTFKDTANSEPPNPPFTNEITQNQNVPPPIGSFLQDYQGRILVYGVPGALQSFFFSNIESTVVGQPPESFALLNEVTLPVGESQLNGMANLPTGNVIWSSKQDMFKLTGTLTDNTVANAQQLGATIQRLPYKIGCASPYATAVTSLGAFWLSSDREVWLFTDHYAPKNIGKPIQDLLTKATRISFARMKNYKAGDRNWLALAITIGESTHNNTLCLLDLDLLASNGQPSFFTFDMATNQPSWYVYNVNCESIEAAFDSKSTNHLLAGDVDLITDLDWTDGYYTVSAEESVPAPSLILHALGNQDPEVIKTGRWMRVTTNQLPKNLASQGWNWNILCYDDDKYVLGINPQLVKLVPGVDSPNQVFGLEYSPSVFRFGGIKPVKGRRFQIQANFPSGPGFYELRGYQVSYDQVVAR